MCQVIPFTLPCCRRVYVEVTKLPSCPGSWPLRKCPPELCIQLRGCEAEERVDGICWRCKALNAGAAGHDREALRPKIDRATLALGLEELGISGRRRAVEKGGHCWFCGAKGGCEGCGAKEIVVGEGETKHEAVGKRKRFVGNVKGKEREVNKRVKIEQETPRPQLLQPPASTQGFEYPDPEASSTWPLHPYPSVYAQDFGANKYRHDGLPNTFADPRFGFVSPQESYQGGWQAVNNQHHQHNQGEASSSNERGQHELSQHPPGAFEYHANQFATYSAPTPRMSDNQATPPTQHGGQAYASDDSVQQHMNQFSPGAAVKYDPTLLLTHTGQSPPKSGNQAIQPEVGTI